MPVAVVRGVGDHEGGEALVAERSMVGAQDAGHEGGRGDAFGWELRVFSKERNGFSDQGASADVADESDEIAAVRVDEIERGRVALAAGLVAIAAEHLKRKHSAQRLALLARAARRNPASHFRAQEVGQLL